MRATRPKSPASLLPLWDVVEDTIITTQGCYLRGFELSTLDSEHMPSDALGRAARLLYDGAKGELREDLLFQLTLTAGSSYDDLWARVAAVPPSDDAVLELQRSRRLRFLRSLPAPRFKVHLFCGSRRGFTRGEFRQLSQELHAQRLAEALDVGKEASAFFERVDLRLRPLSGAEILGLFRQGLFSQAPSLAARTLDVTGRAGRARLLSLREQMLSNPISWNDDHVRIGPWYVKVLSLKVLPDVTRFSCMEVFLHLPGAFRLSALMAVPEQGAARQNVRVAHRLANADAFREAHVQDAERLGRLHQADDLASLLAETKQKLVLAGLQLVLWAPSLEQLETRVRAVTDYLSPYQFVFVEETCRHDRELFKSLPGMATTWDRWKLMPSNNAVDLMPLFGACHGDRRPVFLVRTARGELFSYDPVEPARDNWNACVFGASGSGKSVFMNMLITTAMLANATRGRLMIVDFAGETKSSYRMVAELFGGQFIPILSRSSTFSLNPFPTKRNAVIDEGVAGEVMAFLSVLTDMLLINTEESKDTQLYRLIIRSAIADAYRDLASLDAAPTYDSVFAVLRGYAGRPDLDPARLGVLLTLLEGFLRTPEASLFNRPDATTIDSDFVIFDLFGIDTLPPALQQAVAFLVCHHVKQLAFDASDAATKYVVLDEVAQLLRRPEMTALVHELYSTARKHNTSIWTVTQKYSDYVRSAVAGTINLNSTTQLFLSHATAAGLRREIADDFEMHERERFLFESLRTRKGELSEALLRTEIWDEAREEKRRISAKIRIELSPFDYELATSDARDREIQRRFLAANPGLPTAEVLDAVIRWKEKGRAGR